MQVIPIGILVATSAGLLAGAAPGSEPPAVELRGPYYGQETPGLQAKVFAPGLISQRGRYEFALAWSPAGDELLVSTQRPGQPAVIQHSRVEAGRWTEPAPVRLSAGARREEMEAFFSPGGERIFFAPYDEGMDVRIWSLEVDESGWHDPKELGPPLADSPAFYPTVSEQGTLYFTNLAERRVFRGRLDGASVIGIEDAGLAFGGHAFIAPDESFVLLDAKPPGIVGESDIYAAFRQPDGSWTVPRNLGSEVNSEYSETCPSLSADGRYLFFSRYDEEGEISDIYWIQSTVVEAAREGFQARAAFDTLTSLAGSWRGKGGRIEAEPEAVVHEIEVAAGGSVVMEVMDPEGEREINIYHLQGDDLLLIHYCGGGSQPVLKLDLETAAPGWLPFDLVGGTGFDPAADRHIHRARLVIRQGGHLESWWTAEKEGQVVMQSRFVLQRDATQR